MQKYPNNGFFSYYQLLRQSSDFTGFLRGLQTLLRITIQVLKDAGIELFFLLLFWIIVTKMSQGRDLIVSLFEPDSIYTGWRVFFTVLSAICLSVSMWIIPAFLFQQRDNRNQNRQGYQSIFHKHLFFAHRVLPLIPFWLLAFVLFNGKYTWIWFVLYSAIQLWLLFFFNKKIKESRKRMLFGVGTFVLLIVAVIVFSFLYEKTYIEAKIALCVILYLLAFVMHFVYHLADFELLKEHSQSNLAEASTIRKYPLNSGFYFFMLFVHLFMIFFLFTRHRVSYAPESIPLYIFSLYVFVIDLFVYIINVTPKRRMIATSAIAVIIIIYLLPWAHLNLKHFSIDRIKEQSVLKGKERLTFEARYQELKKKMEADTSSEPYPIVLVSGEGGGSRGALWFSQNLINFDYLTQGRFRDHIFSVSTVSGSTVGLETVFSFWEKTQPGPIDTTWLDAPLNTYSNNFVGSSVTGLLLTDLWKTFIPGSWTRDRNSVLQEEEAYETERACRIALNQKDSDIPEDSLLLRKDFMYFFYDTSGNSLRFKNRPLVLINTCRSNDGRRGIISPIKLVDSVFSDAVDIGGYLYEDLFFKNTKSRDTSARNISFEQACNTSELFPLFSAPLYYDSLGSFVDGGYHENSGLKTTLDVYQKLQKLLSQDPPKKAYKIYIVYLKNGSGEKNLYKPIKSETPLELPLKALSNQPFAGSESFFEEKARLTDKSSGMQFIQLQLDNKFVVDITDTTAATKNGKRTIEQEIIRDLRSGNDTTTLNFPLARWLSKSVSRRIRLVTIPIKRPTRQNINDSLMIKLLYDIQARYKLEDVAQKPIEKWDPNPNRNLLNERQKIVDR
jgi:hypothetical protein